MLRWVGGPNGETAVLGDGRQPCSLMLIGEAPSWEEMKEGRPFVGLSGQVLWEFMKRYAALTRSDCYVTNLIKHQLEKDKEPTEAEIEYWTTELDAEIQRVQPDYIVTLGRHSTRWFLGPDVTMEMSHGLPYPHHYATRGDGPARSNPIDVRPVTIIPCFHPAAGLHQTRQLTQTRLDLEAVGEIVRGRGPKLAVDEHLEPKYFEGLPAGPASLCAIDTEGWADDPWSLQWCIKPGEAGLVRASDTTKVGCFKLWLNVRRPLVILHNALHDLVVLRAMGIDLDALGLRYVDSMVMAFDTQVLPQGLKPLAYRLCGMKMESWSNTIGVYDHHVVARYLKQILRRAVDWPAGIGRKQGIVRRVVNVVRADWSEESPRARWLKIEEELRAPVEGILGPMPKLQMADVPWERFLHYACKDPDATLRAYQKLVGIVVEKELIPLTKIDQGVLPMVSRMQDVGLRCDVGKLEELAPDLNAQCADQLEICRLLADKADFNPGSAKQKEAKLFFGENQGGLLLDYGRMTKGGDHFKTDSNTLMKIKDDHPLVPALLKYSELTKLKTAYVDKLLAMAPKGEKFFVYHPDFSVTRPGRDDTGATAVVTGRMADWILTFPARTAMGRRIRSCFTAPEGWLLGSADLSQIELRLAADESKDVAMLEAFWAGRDLHTATAAGIFGVPYESVDKLTQRYPMKTFNFRLLYGGQPQGLYDELMSQEQEVPGLTLALVEKWHRDWFALYNGVAEDMEATITRTRQTGMSVDRWGRMRHLPAIHLHGDGSRAGKKLDMLRLEAERQAYNHKIQSGAQGVIKRAQIRWWFNERPALPAGGVEPLLQYHDEILLLFKQPLEEQVREATLRAMTADAPLFCVPILSDWASGESWGSLKE